LLFHIFFYAGRIKPVTNQVECHPYLNQSSLKAFCEKNGICITAYSPLGNPGRHRALRGELKLLEDPTILEIANNHGKTPAQVLINYQIQQGNVTIAKSMTLSRIQENFNSFDFKMCDKEMKAIHAMNINRRNCQEVR
jgi:aldehyde reductase